MRHDRIFSSEQILKKLCICLRILCLVIHQKITGGIGTQQTKPLIRQSIHIVGADIIAIHGNTAAFLLRNTLLLCHAALYTCCLRFRAPTAKRHTGHKKRQTQNTNTYSSKHPASHSKYLLFFARQCSHPQHEYWHLFNLPDIPILQFIDIYSNQ